MKNKSTLSSLLSSLARKWKKNSISLAPFDNKKGSILAYSLVIIATMLAIAGSLSVSSVIEKKSASGTEFSMQSLQTADSGVQVALKMINAELRDANPGSITDALGVACDSEMSGPTGSSYKLTFLDRDGAPLTCDKEVSLVSNIKSVGTYKNTVRAVDVSVAPPVLPCSATTPANSLCSFDGLTYGTVTAANGEIWLDRNLGATRKATASNDAAAYGHYYQWGRKTDGHQIETSSIVTTLSSFDEPGHSSFIRDVDIVAPWDWRDPRNDNLWQGSPILNNPCPDGFHVPTYNDWNEFKNSEVITNIDTAFSSTLKLVAAGHRNRNGGMSGRATLGYYWASEENGTNSRNFQDTATTAIMSSNQRANGFSVRCIKD